VIPPYHPAATGLVISSNVSFLIALAGPGQRLAGAVKAQPGAQPSQAVGRPTLGGAEKAVPTGPMFQVWPLGLNAGSLAGAARTGGHCLLWSMTWWLTR